MYKMNYISEYLVNACRHKIINPGFIVSVNSQAKMSKHSLFHAFDVCLFFGHMFLTVGRINQAN